MSLAKGTVNPLNVLGLRRLDFIPKHFTWIRITNQDVSKIEQWIYMSLNSRYCIKKTPGIINDKISDVCLIGFEDPHDATMLVLTCPHFKN